ncbi:carotenoid oxygenase family protein [Parvularcula sp. IMCC14364]|uniref:carotenoid oxygenase family protein n=1 Tax=Parvularcula sp. IMCC14364 TaxID=3067902 RepID=UPI0035572EFC
MPATVVSEIKPTLSENDHPYMNGVWTPNYIEYDATDMEVIGEIPTDMNGVYIRNTENPVHDPIGMYHPFDGDGMLHMMHFANGKATYRNRFVCTRGFEAEAEAGGPLWVGLAGNPAKSKRPGWGAHERLKDSSSTDVVVHAGQVLSTFYQCGEGYRLDPVTLDQLGIESWTPIDGISAHPKVDEATGELLFFNYSKHHPYMHYGVVGPDNELKHYIPVELPGPRLPHDMAFSRNYSILNDLPVFWPEALLEKDIHASIYHPDMPARFAIVPRYGQPDEIKWFEAASTYVLHWMNAYEEGDEVILDGYFQNDPTPPEVKDGPEKYRKLRAYVDLHSLKPELHRWRFNLKTGETREETLYNDEIVEFGVINQKVAGEKHRYIYSVTSRPGWFLFTGVLKHDLEQGVTIRYDFGEERYGSEAPFVPRDGASDEDDGYLVSFITDMKENRSECVILDAKDIEAGPVARIMLPHRICSGTHATWASSDDIRAAR